jgi:hypothetical protein
VITHHHRPGVVDVSGRWVCAREAALLDHNHRVQREEDTLRATQHWAG